MVSSAGITTSSSTSTLTSSRVVTTEKQPVFMPAQQTLIQSTVVDMSWHGPPISKASAATSKAVFLLIHARIQHGHWVAILISMSI